VRFVYIEVTPEKSRSSKQVVKHSFKRKQSMGFHQSQKKFGTDFNVRSIRFFIFYKLRFPSGKNSLWEQYLRNRDSWQS